VHPTNGAIMEIYKTTKEELLHIRVDDVMKAWLKRKGQQIDASMSDIVRTLIKNEMDAEKKKSA
jgi:hypothetical protein